MRALLVLAVLSLAGCAFPETNVITPTPPMGYAEKVRDMLAQNNYRMTNVSQIWMTPPTLVGVTIHTARNGQEISRRNAYRGWATCGIIEGRSLIGGAVTRMTVPIVLRSDGVLSTHDALQNLCPDRERPEERGAVTLPLQGPVPDSSIPLLSPPRSSRTSDFEAGNKPGQGKLRI
jgi:hypothetical protein